MKKVLVVMLCYNTDKQTRGVLQKFPSQRDYDFLVVNDGSTDKTSEVIKNFAEKYDLEITQHPQNKGVGGALKSGLDYALLKGYEVMAVMAGNDKDNPLEINRLIDPILNHNYDYVQGSRFLKGGKWDNLPRFRYIMVKVHAFLFTLLTGTKCTDSLNGFRAYKMSVFKDPRINVWQDWLDKYELETYLHFKLLKLGYRFKEVPVSKTYPHNWRKVKYSHIRPFIDWWSILNPLLFLSLRLRK
ncbi:MAG: glycosyltransferase family 2 protein [Acidobacteriota bacterium]